VFCLLIVIAFQFLSHYILSLSPGSDDTVCKPSGQGIVIDSLGLRDLSRGETVNLLAADFQNKMIKKLMRNPVDTLDRFSLTIPDTSNCSDIFRDGNLSAEAALSGYGSGKVGAEKL
jgi:hypothetical protein